MNITTNQEVGRNNTSIMLWAPKDKDAKYEAVGGFMDTDTNKRYICFLWKSNRRNGAKMVLSILEAREQ